MKTTRSAVVTLSVPRLREALDDLLPRRRDIAVGCVRVRPLGGRVEVSVLPPGAEPETGAKDFVLHPGPGEDRAAMATRMAREAFEGARPYWNPAEDRRRMIEAAIISLSRQAAARPMAMA